VIPHRFKEVDRVAERPKASLISAIRKESRARVAQYTAQRYGTVISSRVKQSVARNKVISRQVYVKILWDGMKTPAEHAQMRICFIEELKQLQQDFFAVTDSLMV
jgi:predicted kinase